MATVEPEPQPQVLEPPEAPATHPAWHTPATWNAQHGLWERCGGIVPTAATVENVRRYRASKRPQVLAAPPSPVEVKPEPEPSEEHAARLQLARDTGRILSVFPGARLLRSGDWKIKGQHYDLDNALLLCAHTTGTTSNGFEVGTAFEPADNDTQVLEGEAQ